MKLSENFTLEELCASYTANALRITNIPNQTQENNLKVLACEVLQPTRDEWGKPIVITSAFRCPDLNKAVGGVKNSYHLNGQAADIKVTSDEEAQKLAKLLNKQKLTDKVIYEKSGKRRWIHVQWSYAPRHLIIKMNV